MAEPEIVVANREHLWWLLAEASQLEHMIMCQYLFAEFTLKSADELTADQAKVVDRWRETLRGIAVEEMLHLALVSNLMAAIGAAPTFGRPNFPCRSGYFPAAMQLDLLPFGEQALQHFLYMERPEGMERQDPEMFVPAAPPLEPLDASEAMPHGQEFTTIGHLYRGVERGLVTLADRFGERALFVGSPRAQATPERFSWPQMIAVTDPATAQAAVDEIIEQGEGARGDWKDAHYGRFLAVWQEYEDLRERDASFQPARPSRVLPAAVRRRRAGSSHHRSPHPPGGRSDRTRLRAGGAPPDALLHPHGRNRRAARRARELRDRHDGRRSAPARDDDDHLADRTRAAWIHGRLLVRSVLCNGQPRAMAGAGMGIAARTRSHPGRALRGARGRRRHGA